MTDAAPTKPKDKTAAKAGRNKAYCAKYKLSNSAVQRKKARIAKHLERYAPAPEWLKRSAYHAKRYAKALRQLDKAIDNSDDGARMKAAYYVERFHP